MRFDQDFRSPSGITILDAIECMVATLGPPGPNVLLCSTVDKDGIVGPGNCFDLRGAPPSYDCVFQLAASLGAPAVLCGSRAAHSLLEPDDADFRLTRWLMDGAVRSNISLAEHIIVKDDMFRVMKKSLEEGLR
ncbi:MAG TPA: hypothetical protein VG929_05930 [Actinomycetota bacterium]|nr:hypothetical protein [Actinomycetota bacterium]